MFRNMPHMLTNTLKFNVFKWVIEDIEMFLIDNVPVLCYFSPKFKFEAIKNTEWQLHIRDSDDDDYLDCEIIRCDEGTQSVEVEYVLSLLDENHNGVVYKVGCSHAAINASGSLNIEKFIKKSKVVVDVSIMLQIRQSNTRTIEMNEDYILSKDLSSLYRNQFFSDMSISTNEGLVKAHKFMIALRWPDLAKTVEPYELSSVSYVFSSASVVKAILCYVYYGEIESSCFNYDLHTTAVQHRFPELVEHFNTFSHTSYATTVNSYTMITVNYLLDTVDFLNGRSRTYCQKMTSVYTDVLYTLEFSKVALERFKFKITFNFTSVEDEKPVFFKAELKLFANNRRTELFYKTLNYYVTDNDLIFSHYFLLDKESLMKESLELNCSAYVSDRTYNSELKRTIMEVTEELPNFSHVRKLKTDLAKLYDTMKYSDVILMCEDRTFKAHAAILCCRSDKFNELLQQAETTDSLVLKVDDIEATDLEILLKYIYGVDISEEILNSKAETLYKACDLYKVLPLRKICLEIITGKKLANLSVSK